MWNTWIGGRIRRGNRAFQLWGLFFLVVAAGIGLLMRYAVYNFFAGPFPVNMGTLRAIKDPDDAKRYFVTFAVDKVQKTGIGLQDSKSKATYSEYVVVKAEDRFLLIELPTDHAGLTVTGTIGKPSKDEQEKVLAVLENQVPGVKSALLPFIVCARGYSFQAGVISGLVGLAVLVGLGLWLVSIGVRRTRRPERHPLGRALERFGPLTEVAEAIDRDSRTGQCLRLGPVEFRGRWLICTRFGNCKIFQLDNLVWVYKKIVRVNGFPVYWVKFHDCQGESFEVNETQARVDGVIAAVNVVTPWLISGYDERLAAIWKKDPTALVAAVKDRQRQFEQGGQPPVPEERPDDGRTG
jgi:hypothetical protein